VSVEVEAAEVLLNRDEEILCCDGMEWLLLMIVYSLLVDV
jgi:hypothetical protein